METTESINRGTRASLAMIVLMIVCILACTVSVAYYADEYIARLHELDIVKAQCDKVAEQVQP